MYGCAPRARAGAVVHHVCALRRRCCVPCAAAAAALLSPLSSRLLPPLLNRKSTERPTDRLPPTYFGRDLGDWARPSLFRLVFFFTVPPGILPPSLPTSFHSAASGVMRVHYPSVRVRVRTTGQRGETAPLSLPPSLSIADLLARSIAASLVPPTALFVKRKAEARACGRSLVLARSPFPEQCPAGRGRERGRICNRRSKT